MPRIDSHCYSADAVKEKTSRWYITIREPHPAGRQRKIIYLHITSRSRKEDYDPLGNVTY